jgi:predicted unusual protein kinase regulating ubiquinone biosynthesis (AarF/ABC1/UbiB family)
MKFLSSIIISFFPSRACASISLPDSLVHFTVPWKRVIQAFVSLFLLSSGIFNHQVKKRQEKLATSEWARYAEHPSARGRAIMWLLTQQTVFLILSKVLWFRRRAIQEYAGKHFADSLLKLGPLYIKLGQIISCRKDMLGSEWIDAMATLQDKVPARTGQEAMDLAYSTLEGGKEEFDTLFSNFDPTPLAAASLGQVHKARLRKTGSEVAVKLQRPFLRQIYDQDLKFLTKIAKMMDNLPSSRKNVGGVSSSWTKIFQDAKIILYREIDYRYEARNAVRFSEDFGLALGGRAAPTCNAKCKNDDFLPSAAEWIRTPYIFEDISNERLLVMEFVPSIKITDTVKLDAAKVTEEDKIELADALARAYLRQFCCNLFFSTGEFL